MKPGTTVQKVPIHAEEESTLWHVAIPFEEPITSAHFRFGNRFLR